MDAVFDVVRILFGKSPELRNIILVTLRMSFTSTIISAMLGITLGVLIGSNHFRFKGLVIRVISTLMSLPPVVAGLIVFMLLSRKGPLGQFRLLYTVNAMVIAQVLLITPIIIGLSSAVISARSQAIKETAIGLGLSKFTQLGLMVYESKNELLSVVLSGFGRAIAEVGAVQLVGGNIQHKTRVMTTAIMLETNMGNFNFAIALGFVLLLISFIINSLVRSFEEGSSIKSAR